MQFWNKMLLIGLAGVAVPIIIHLLNRRRARVLEWGAMRFLLGSVAARRRRILIQEIILMILRCLLLALVALALARPFLRSESAIPWPLVLPACLAGVVLLAVAGAAWHHRQIRLYLLAAALGLFVLAGGASATEHFFQAGLLPSGSGGKDVAIIIDGSLSMSLSGGGKETSFRDAVAEAAGIVEACNPSDTVSIFLAGPVPRELTRGPQKDKKHLLGLLREARPTDGPANFMRAVEAAATQLQSGHNTDKKIVLLTDGQVYGWKLKSRESWRRLTDSLTDGFSDKPLQIICRRLGTPAEITNAGIEDVTFSHKVVGVGRPVRVEVNVRNYGTSAFSASTVRLHAEGLETPLAEPMPDIAPGGSRRAGFDCRFDAPGPHVVTAALVGVGEDQITGDDTAVRVVDVIEKLPVLVVDGAPSRNLEDSAAGFLTVALSLRDDLLGGAPAKPAKGRAKPGEDELKSTIQPLVVLPEALHREKDLGAYRAVILANVARLPAAQAARVAAYVEGGGGLLIVAGDRATAGFYNNWTGPGGSAVAPARLPEERTFAAEGESLGLESFTHAAIRALVESGESEAGSVAVSAYWRLEGREKERPGVRAALASGQPLLVERRVGKGPVVMTSVGFDGHDTTLAKTNFFLPFAHELVYHLAEGAAVDWNILPGAKVALPQAAGASKPLAEQIKVVRIRFDENGEEKAEAVSLPVKIEADEKAVKISALSFERTAEPGLFRFVLPEKMDGLLAGTVAAGKGLPFTVRRDAAESNLTPLEEEEIDLIRSRFNSKSVHFHDVVSAEEAIGIIERSPGREIWKYLALSALILLLGETAFARWISSERRAHSAEAVEFGGSADAATELAENTQGAAATRGRARRESRDAVGSGTL